MSNYNFISEIEKFLEGEASYEDAVEGFEPDPSQVAKKRNKEIIRGVEEEEKELDSSSSDIEPDLTGNLDKEDIIMPEFLDPERGNSIEEFMNRFNILRATKSLKSEEVFYKFKDYFKSLKYEERLAFYTFIVGMTQVTTLSLSDEDKGSKPSDFGIKITYQNKAEKEKEEKPETKSTEKVQSDSDEVQVANVFSKKKSFVSVINTESVQDKSKILDYLKLING